MSFFIFFQVFATISMEQFEAGKFRSKPPHKIMSHAANASTAETYAKTVLKGSSFVGDGSTPLPTCKDFTIERVLNAYEGGVLVFNTHTQTGESYATFIVGMLDKILPELNLILNKFMESYNKAYGTNPAPVVTTPVLPQQTVVSSGDFPPTTQNTGKPLTDEAPADFSEKTASFIQTEAERCLKEEEAFLKRIRKENVNKYNVWCLIPERNRISAASFRLERLRRQIVGKTNDDIASEIGKKRAIHTENSKLVDEYISINKERREGRVSSSDRKTKEDRFIELTEILKNINSKKTEKKVVNSLNIEDVQEEIQELGEDLTWLEEFQKMLREEKVEALATLEQTIKKLKETDPSEVFASSADELPFESVKKIFSRLRENFMSHSGDKKILVEIERFEELQTLSPTDRKIADRRKQLDLIQEKIKKLEEEENIIIEAIEIGGEKYTKGYHKDREDVRRLDREWSDLRTTYQHILKVYAYTEEEIKTDILGQLQDLRWSEKVSKMTEKEKTAARASLQPVIELLRNALFVKKVDGHTA